MMTEPDLVTIKEGAVVDEASLICHINSRGHFALNALLVDAGATMRSGSRLLSGATMEPFSTLLEHTLVFGGDVVPEASTMQVKELHAVKPVFFLLSLLTLLQIPIFRAGLPNMMILGNLLSMKKAEATLLIRFLVSGVAYLGR